MVLLRSQSIELSVG